jgi:hypothetical protein
VRELAPVPHTHCLFLVRPRASLATQSADRYLRARGVHSPYSRVVAFLATVFKVLIASPTDTTEFRNAVETSLHAWNGSRAQGSGFVLLPRRWETDAVPDLDGSDGQSVINRQLVDDADIVIALFHIRLGRATPRAVSGTVEELTKARDDGKRVHLYFSGTPLPRDFDADAYEDLMKFRKAAEKLGLFGSFDSSADLSEKVRNAVEYDISALIELGTVPASPTAAPRVEAHAELVVSYMKSGRSETLRVTNTGTAVASDIRMTLSSRESDQKAPSPWGAEEPFTLRPGGHFDMHLQTYAGTALHVDAKLDWLEDGEVHETVQSVSLL